MRADLLLLGGLSVKIRAGINLVAYAEAQAETVPLHSSFIHARNFCGRVRPYSSLTPITESSLNNNESGLMLCKPPPRLHFLSSALFVEELYVS